MKSLIDIEIDGTNLYAEVAYDVDVFSVVGKIIISKSSTWSMYSDILGENELILKNMSLTEGWTKSYIVVWSENKQHFTQYTLNVYRLQERTFTFFVNNDNFEIGKVIERNTITAPTTNPTRDGYEFFGWMVENELVDFPYLINTDTTFIPKWEATTNRLLFDANGGMGTMANLSIKTDETVNLIPNQFINNVCTFIGWSQSKNGEVEYLDGANFKMVSKSIYTLYAVWGIEVQFDSDGGTELESLYGKPGSSIIEPFTPSKPGFDFCGWFVNESFNEKFTFNFFPSENITLYAKWIKIFSFVTVGEKGTTYTVPTTINDSEKALVKGGYEMASTETTYELWYEVRIWAETNGYYFQNKGKEGSYGQIGAAPISEKLEPVNFISWRDIIIWCNAYSEYKGLNPVYRSISGIIIKDSRDANGEIVDSAVQTINNGYRLPTSNEWEMASRWRNASGDGSIEVEGRYWTPGNYASGAIDDFAN